MTALLAVQAAAPTLAKNADNPAFKGSKYVPLDTIVETIGPLLAEHGLVWTTLPGRADDGVPVLSYRLIHAATGETLAGEMPLLLSKQDAQGMGSAITYARRYSITAVLNLVADVDDDGNAASAVGQRSRGNGRQQQAREPLSAEKVAEAVNAFKASGMDMEWARTQLVGLGAQNVPEGSITTGTLAALTPEQHAKFVGLCGEAGNS